MAQRRYAAAVVAFLAVTLNAAGERADAPRKPVEPSLFTPLEPPYQR
jgi:hypothetical protein